MEFIATSTNISAISWQSVLLEEETGISGENHRKYIVYSSYMLNIQLYIHTIFVKTLLFNHDGYILKQLILAIFIKYIRKTVHLRLSTRYIKTKYASKTLKK